MATYGKPLAGVCASTALFVCGVAGVPVAPAELAPANGALVLSASDNGTPQVLRPGATVVLGGSGFADAAAINVSVYSTPVSLGNLVADDEGQFTTAVTLPKDLTGRHTLSAIGNAPNGSGRSVQASVTLAADTPAAVGISQLPKTGIQAASAVLGAGGLLIVGFALIRTAGYRRRFMPVGS